MAIHSPKTALLWCLMGKDKLASFMRACYLDILTITLPLTHVTAPYLPNLGRKKRRSESDH